MWYSAVKRSRIGLIRTNAHRLFTARLSYLQVLAYIYLMLVINVRRLAYAKVTVDLCKCSIKLYHTMR